jgi:hypothetical protein
VVYYRRQQQLCLVVRCVAVCVFPASSCKFPSKRATPSLQQPDAIFILLLLLLLLLLLQGPPWSAPLLGPAREGTAHQDHWPPRQDRGCGKEALSSYISSSYRQLAGAVLCCVMCCCCWCQLQLQEVLLQWQ